MQHNLLSVLVAKENSVDKRLNIMTMATKLFGERGYEDVSTRDIAAAADVNMAMIAYYFKSKEGLLDAIVAERIPMFGARIAEIKRMNLSAWQKLTLVFDEYCDKMIAQPDFSRMVWRQITYAQQTPTTQRILDELGKNRALILEIFEEGKNNGEFNSQTNYRFVLLTFFSTISTVVKSPCMTMSMMGLETERDVFSENFVEQLKSFFRDFFFRFVK